MSLGDKSLARSCVMWGDIMGASNYEQGGDRGSLKERNMLVLTQLKTFPFKR